jgi:hypothetical protein
MRWFALLAALLPIACQTTREAERPAGYRGIEEVTILTKGME